MTRIELPAEPISGGHFIAGKWTPGTGTVTPVISPYYGQSVGSVRAATSQEVNQAVDAAALAAHTWGRTPIKERSQTLYRFREILLREQDRISQRISLENGKTLAESKAGLMKGIEVLEFALSVQNMDQGGRIEVSRGVYCEYRREPMGVVAGITPFNFPAMVPMWMLPIAIVTGNAFVWKPSDKTPLTSLLLGDAANEAGIPAGILTILQGGRQTVEAILDHQGISAVGFVGSTPIARAVYTRGSSAGKRVLALGGAKNPIILMPDADPELASTGIAESFTGCAGQRCMAASVLLVVGDCDSILEQVIAKAGTLIPGKNMGAIISKESRDRLVAAINRAEKEGARVLLDGRANIKSAEYPDGFWLGPTVLDGVKPGTPAACDELFGPVLSVIRVKTLSEALEFERSSPYGNAASVFTSSGSVAQRVAEEAHAGMIGVNVGVPVPREPFSFGGFNDSKFGHGDITGPSSLDFWASQKKITTRWFPSRDRNWMS